MKRRLLRIGMVLVATVVLCAIAATYLVPRHQRGIEDWIGSQLQTVANSYLNPKLSFSDLTYEYPRGVSLKNLRLTANDPAHPGQTIDIIAAGRATISLAEIPSVGKPVIIEKIVLDRPLISAVAIEPRSENFIGFSNLLRTGSTSSSSAETVSVSNQKLSDVFRMRLLQITDGKIVYDPRIPGTSPMTLDKINTTLHIEPSDAGWYKFDTGITRSPVFDLQLRGLINLDTFTGRDLDVKLLADLGQDKLDYLPPELQAVLKQYDAKGKLSLVVTGSLPIMDPLSGHAKATIKLDHANIAMNGLHIPVDNLELNSSFENGQVTVPSLKIAALGGSVDLSGSAKLNDRLDTELHLKIAGARPEQLLADPALGSGSDLRLDLDFNFAGPLMCILGKTPPKAGEPLASIAVKDFRISAKDPANHEQVVDLLACKNLDVAITEPIVAGKPIVIDKIILNQPTISAIAVAPGSSRFVGVPNLATLSTGSAGQTGLRPKETAVAFRLGDFLRVNSLQLKDAKVIYDSRVAGTERLVLDPINVSLNYVTDRIAGKTIADSQSGDKYDFDTHITSNADLKLQVAGRIDLDTQIVDPLKLNVSAAFGGNLARFLPPTLQRSLQPFNPTGSLAVSVVGKLPLFNPTAAEFDAELKLDNFAVTAGKYRIPVNRVRLPVLFKPGHLQILDSAALGGTTLEAFDGSAKITGEITLNPQLDSTLSIGIDRMRLQSLLADQIAGPKKDLAGDLHANIQLVRAPLLTIIARASAQPGTPSVAPDDLPGNWGSANVELTHAKLTGFALIQGMTNFARSAFAALFKSDQSNKTIVAAPTESATATMTFQKDHVAISNLHYEGEDVGADGNGYLTLAQVVNLDITGGPISKLAGLGTVGSWIQKAGDSLLYYHVSGTLQDIKVEARRGDAHPIVSGAKDIAGQGTKAVGDGLNKAGAIINGIFNHGDQHK